jgi:hypothetical protein
MPKNPMTKEAASRIQSSQAKSNKDTGKKSFAARAQSAADQYANTQASQQASGGTQQQGGK